MAATLDQIESALLAPWTSGTWTATTDVALENFGYTPTPDVAWMEVTTSGGPSTRIGVGNVEVGNPTLTISAHVPLGWGKSMARQLLDAAAALYRDVRYAAGTSTLLAYSFSAPVELPRDGWFKLTQQISFRLI